MHMKSIFAILATSVLTMSVIGSVYANDGGQYSPKGTVKFTPSDKPTKPVNPLNPNPESPIIPSVPDGSKVDDGTAGPLSLDFASSLDFGIQQITSTTVSYNASAQKYSDQYGHNETSGPDFVQLTDNRGTFSGWTLSVKQVGQFKTANGDELHGASVTFMSAQHTSVNGSSDGISLVSSFTLDPNGSAIPVMSGNYATKGTNGTDGTHIMRFGDATTLSQSDINGDGSSRGLTDTAIKLSIPGKTQKLSTSYTTVLNWILGDTPSSVSVVK